VKRCSDGSDWYDLSANPVFRNCALFGFDGGNYRFEFEYLPSEYTTKRCPLSLRTDETNRFMRLWKQAKAFNMTVYAGGIYDQPARTMEAMSVLESEWNKIESQKLEDIKKKK